MLRLPLLLCLAIAAATAADAGAAPAPALPAHEQALPANGFASCASLDSLAGLITSNIGSDGKPAATLVECAIAGGTAKALRVTVLEKPAHPWDVQARQSGVVELPAGSIVHLRMRLRSPGGATVFAAIQESVAPHSKLVERVVTLGPDWTTVDLPAEVKSGLAAKAWGWTLHLGNRPQTVEIAGVECLSWQKDVKLADLPATH